MSDPPSLTRDLDGYWPLDSDGSDTSGNNLDGTLEGNASITSSSKIGSGALTLDGDGDFLSLTDDDLINTADVRQQRTVSAWFQVDDPTITSRKQVIWEEGGLVIGYGAGKPGLGTYRGYGHWFGAGHERKHTVSRWNQHRDQLV